MPVLRQPPKRTSSQRYERVPLAYGRHATISGEPMLTSGANAAAIGLTPFLDDP